MFQRYLAEPELRNKINSRVRDINSAARSLNDIIFTTLRDVNRQLLKVDVGKRSGLIQTYENSDIDLCRMEKFTLIIQMILLLEVSISNCTRSMRKVES